MTGVNGQEPEWHEGDYAWADSAQHDDGAMWSRGLSKWYELPDNLDERTDAEMTAAGAVLVATADGPAPSAEVASLRAQVAAVEVSLNRDVTGVLFAVGHSTTDDDIADAICDLIEKLAAKIGAALAGGAR